MPVVVMGSWDQRDAATPTLRHPAWWAATPPALARRIDTTLTPAIPSRDYSVGAALSWIPGAFIFDATGMPTARVVRMEIVNLPSAGAPAVITHVPYSTNMASDTRSWPNTLGASDHNPGGAHHPWTFGLHGDLGAILRIRTTVAPVVGESVVVRGTLYEWASRELVLTGVSDLAPDGV